MADSKTTSSDANAAAPAPAANANSAAAAKWANRLRSPLRMSLCCIGGLFAMGLFGIANPLSDRVNAAQARVDKAKERAILAGEVNALQHQQFNYHKRLPRGVDLNDW